MSFDEYMAKYNGVGVDTDQAFGNQCMDNMHKYCQDVLGLDLSVLAAPAAKDVYLNFANINGHDHFDKIDNTPTGVPQKGDIMFWGTGIGPYGHVAVFKDGDTNKFNSFDQNWNGHQYCETVSHSYNAVLGWLHPKTAQAVNSTPDAATRLEADTNWNGWTALSNEAGVPSNPQDKAKMQTDGVNAIKMLKSREDDANNLAAERAKLLKDEQVKNQSLREAFDIQTKADADTGTQLLEAQHKTSDYKNYLDSLSKALNLPTADEYAPVFVDTMLKAVSDLQRPVDEQLKPLQDHAIVLNNQLPSLEKKRTSKKDKNLIQRLGGFLSSLLTRKL